MSSDLYYPLHYHQYDPDGQRHHFGSLVKAEPETIEAVIAARRLGECGHKDTFIRSASSPLLSVWQYSREKSCSLS